MIKKVVKRSGSLVLMSGIAYGTLFLMGSNPAIAGFSFVPNPESSAVKAPVVKTDNEKTAEQEQSKTTEAETLKPLPPADIEKQELLPPSVKMAEPKVMPSKVQEEQAQASETPSLVIDETPSDLSHVPAMEEGAGAIVDGFGSSMPLAVALRQIVPSDYGFVFNDAIDLGMRIDWQGGRPWDLVLKDLAQTYDFGIKINNRVVRIGNTVENKPSSSDSIMEMLLCQCLRKKKCHQKRLRY
jgi:hypothetical protein